MATESSRCRDSVGYITATQSRPKPSNSRELDCCIVRGKGNPFLARRVELFQPFPKRSADRRTSLTEPPSIYRKQRFQQEKRPAFSFDEAQRLGDRVSVDCITVTSSPPEGATGGESPSPSSLLWSPGRLAFLILFRPAKLLPVPHARPRET